MNRDFPNCGPGTLSWEEMEQELEDMEAEDEDAAQLYNELGFEHPQLGLLQFDIHQEYFGGTEPIDIRYYASLFRASNGRLLDIVEFLRYRKRCWEHLKDLRTGSA